MSYSAGTYDIFDDRGRLLKTIITDESELPEFVKTASSDVGDAYALIMVEGESILEKYAMDNAGMTWLSCVYFAGRHHDLPLEAQKVAAANLRSAVDYYGGEALFGDQIITFLEKTAAGIEPGNNVVDVTGKLPPVVVQRPEGASEYAIERDDGSKYYPLSSGKSVKLASRYFSQHVGQLVPRERRQFAVKTAAAADAMGLDVTDEVKRYAGTEYNPSLKAFLTARQLHLLEADNPDGVRELAKMASAARHMAPEDFAIYLERFDVENGIDALWDRGMGDPWYATFGMLKSAAAIDGFFDIQGTAVPKASIHALADDDRITEFFGDSFASSFRENPVEVFDSLPTPHKKIIVGLAGE